MPQVSSRDAIVTAAIAEFSEHGFSGTRMERVAKRAGCNKALVYRHFRDKDGLFRAALRSLFEGRSAVLDRLPDDLGDVLAHWFAQSFEDEEFLRLVQREALNDAGGDLVEQDYRRAYYETQIDMLRAYQDRGVIDAGSDVTCLFLALLALVVYPNMVPTISRLATGMPHDSDEFRARWTAMLRELAGRLAPREELADAT